MTILSRGTTMSQLKWDDDLKYSILQLKMNLCAKDFRLAGPAIGLPKRKLATEHKVFQKKNSEALNPKQGFSRTVEAKTPTATPRQNQARQNRAVPRPQSAPSNTPSMIDTFINKSMAHVVDILFVALTICFVLIAAGFVIDPHGFSSDLESIKYWWPYRLVKDLGLKYLLISIYSVFLAYWTVFKLFVGSTLGNFFVVGDSTNIDLFLEQ